MKMPASRRNMPGSVDNTATAACKAMQPAMMAVAANSRTYKGCGLAGSRPSQSSIA